LSVKFLFDEHVQRAITEGLRARGIDVLTVQEDGRAGIPDSEVLDRATELGRCLFTQDEDFKTEAAIRQRAGTAFAGVIYGHRLRISIGLCVRDLEIIAKVSDLADLASRVTYLPL
jgi:hypothetical protein